MRNLCCCNSEEEANCVFLRDEGLIGKPKFYHSLCSFREDGIMFLSNPRQKSIAFKILTIIAIFIKPTKIPSTVCTYIFIPNLAGPRVSIVLGLIFQSSL